MIQPYFLETTQSVNEWWHEIGVCPGPAISLQFVQILQELLAVIPIQSTSVVAMSCYTLMSEPLDQVIPKDSQH